MSHKKTTPAPERLSPVPGITLACTGRVRAVMDGGLLRVDVIIGDTLHTFTGRAA